MEAFLFINMFTVYALKSLNRNYIYVGMTSNLERRFHQHQSGQNKTTKPYLKKVYGSASLVGDDMVVFNIMGNKFRLVIRMVFEFKAIQIKWFGTHVEYDKIDVSIINYKKN